MNFLPAVQANSSQERYEDAGSNGQRLSRLQRPDSSGRTGRQRRDSRGEDYDNQWLCSHYKRRCYVKFACCEQFWPCHRCHNNQSSCGRKKLKSRDTQQIKCSACGEEQPVCRYLKIDSCVIAFLIVTFPNSRMFSFIDFLIHLTLPHLSLPSLPSSYCALPYLTSSYCTLLKLTPPYCTLPHLTSPHLIVPCLTSPHLIVPYLSSPHLIVLYLSLPHLIFLTSPYFPYLTSLHLIVLYLSSPHLIFLTLPHLILLCLT